MRRRFRARIRNDGATRRDLVGQSQSDTLSEQAGVRPILRFQNDAINRAIGTAVVIPLTSKLRRAALPSCVQVAQGEGGLTAESVTLCHQMRVLDESRLIRKLGVVSAQTMGEAETGVLYTLGIRTN